MLPCTLTNTRSTRHVQDYYYYYSRFWGLACITAHRAYNDSSMLDLAENVWDRVVKYVITASDAAAGSHSSRTVKFSGKCNGGVYCSLPAITGADWMVLTASVVGDMFSVGHQANISLQWTKMFIAV